MKKVLITGANSYIGISLEKWLTKYPDKYSINRLSLRGNSWKEKEFSGYDVVFHVAGVAHIKETKENKELYYRVNRDLAYETAKKAKAGGVRQFIFLSSMSIYGIDNGVIDRNTLPKPNSHYGRSKIQAEKLIEPLSDDLFKVAILRPPMIYGKGCKGNYPRLSNLILKAPIFPGLDNNRSMLYIDNLSGFVKLLIDKCSGGLFFPQNKEYVNTTELARHIAKSHGKKLRVTKVFNFAIAIGLKLSETFRKVFGSLVYNKELLAETSEEVSFEESIERTELE
jgi:UDP-glucose 4-epimerase